LHRDVKHFVSSLGNYRTLSLAKLLPVDKYKYMYMHYDCRLNFERLTTYASTHMGILCSPHEFV
jgi:hypothetical protein